MVGPFSTVSARREDTVEETTVENTIEEYKFNDEEKYIIDTLASMLSVLKMEGEGDDE